MLKPSDNPPIRHPAEAPFDAGESWWVAHTKARAEKQFAWDLYRASIGYFLPLVERVRFSGGRKRRMQLPLFPGYVFFHGTEDDRHAAMRTDRLCQTLPVSEPERFVAELEAIETALTSGYELEQRLAPEAGTLCRVRAGPMKGVEGVTVEGGQASAVFLSVTMLGVGAVVEIEPELLDPIDRAPAEEPRGGIG